MVPCVLKNTLLPYGRLMINVPFIPFSTLHSVSGSSYMIRASRYYYLGSNARTVDTFRY